MVRKIVSLVTLAWTLGGCAAGTKVVADPNTAKNAVLTAETVACAIEHIKDPFPQVMKECNADATLASDLAEVLSTVAASNAEAAKAGAVPCGK